MPELPEVETLCRWLDARLRGEVVASVTLRSIAALKTYDPPIESLRGRRLAGCLRRGKFIDVDAPPLHLVVHLARGGWLRWHDVPTKIRPALRGPIAMVIGFEGGSSLEATEHGTDRRLAISLVRDPMDVPGVARLGIDALSPDLTAPRLGSLLAAAPGLLKNVLADQSVIAGIGNAYSDEILHAARLSPFRRAAALDVDEVEQLLRALRAVLGDAVVRIASLDPSELKADKRTSMRVHGRTGLACPVCGATVCGVSLATRSFQYCPTCQTGGRVYADRRLSRLLR